MTLETLRSYLYLIGFVANFLFAARFFIQWIESEKKGESTVSKLFWQLSLLANILMAVHGYIQLQYPICLIQGLNSCIAWRNLNLMGKKKYPLKRVVLVMSATCLGLTLLFFLQGSREWMRPPALPWSSIQAAPLVLLWHGIGFFGMLLFASRYWIQWWFAEKQQKSFLGKSFWWISSIGALFSLVYSIRLLDPVNILGFSVGLVPYIRNLMLLRKKSPGLKPANSSIFLFAGEQSGDVLGGNLVKALKRQASPLDIYGVGGPLMNQAGMRISHPMERFQVMGFSDVLKALPRLFSDFRKIQNEILKSNPAAVVLIDYPDFNMLLAKRLRKKGYSGKMIHYVCPSVWAWRKKRVKSLAKTLDRLLSILPFEEEHFAHTKLPVTFVGHPLVAAIDNYTYDPTWKINTPVIAIFPGSRKHEIELNLPLQLAAAKKLGPAYTCAVSVARPDLKPLIEKYTEGNEILVPSEKRYELMRIASASLATSGTIILELGLHHVPTVVTYQLATFNYLLGRYAFRILLPHYSLVNIICGKTVFPEFVHKELHPEKIYEALKELIDHPETCQADCLKLRELLSTHDASLKAAETILQGLS